MNPLEHLNSLIAERAPFAEHSAEIHKKGQRIAEERASAERDVRSAEAEQLAHQERVTDAINSGAKLPDPPASLRTALSKAQMASATIRALDSAQNALQNEAIQNAETLKALEARIRTARATVLAEEYLPAFDAECEALDEHQIREGVRGRLYRELFAHDPLVGDEITKKAEARRLEWLNTRIDRIRAEVARRVAEILGRIPS